LQRLPAFVLARAFDLVGRKVQVALHDNGLPGFRLYPVELWPLAVEYRVGDFPGLGHDRATAWWVSS
jgi:hypothetical protein